MIIITRDNKNMLLYPLKYACIYAFKIAKICINMPLFFVKFIAIKEKLKLKENANFI